MILPTIIFFISSLVLSITSLNKFLSLQNQPSLLFLIIIIFAIYIPISITFLLPIDILSSNDDAETRHNIFYLDSKYILFLWKLDYWSAFLLMWIILPFLQEYYRSGQFTSINKTKDSIKKNLKFQLIVGTIASVGLIYYFIKFGFNFQIFKSLLIALSHTYSLILSLWLMSHGLINIPRRRWLNNINLDHQLTTLYLNLPKIYDEFNESNYKFKDICFTIQNLQKIPGIEQSIFQNEVKILNSMIPKNLNLKNHIGSINFNNLNQINISILSKLNSNFKNEFTNFKSSKYEFDQSKLEILKLEDILQSKFNKNLIFRFKYKNLTATKNSKLNYYLYLYIIPYYNIFISLILLILSIIIIESEIFHSTKISIINQLLLTSKISATGKLIISIIFLSYMALSALISLTRIKIFNTYHLFPKSSNPVSIVFFTMYSNRLTIPLSFNFLTLLQTGKIHSNFDDFLGKSINLSVLGGFLNNNLPRLIIIPIILTSFNFFDKLKKKLTFGYFDDFNIDENNNDVHDDFDEENQSSNKKDNLIKEAKSIIQREITSNSFRNYRDSSSSSSNSRLNLVNSNRNSIDTNNSSNDGLNGLNFDQDTNFLDKFKNINVLDKFKNVNFNFFDRFKGQTDRLNIQEEEDDDVDVL